ncbi:MAG: CDP-diacylglycerol--glycerol-3-phosphate 3-phosphatidyltransferase [Azospirillum sp.]|nr:CDP-diacylglycerol--glycerol-3-phosphate 3-phosphatidyltransferase [Azospirillum sp.]
MLTSLPNLLTLSRILVIPPMVGLFFVPEAWAVWTNLALFAAAAATDWLDGMLARRLAVISALGRFLDPIADKLLVAAVLFMLVAAGRLNGLGVIPAVVILMREVMISGLREFLAGTGIGLPVSRLAKSKTALQMVALALLILGNQAPLGLPATALGTAGLWLAAVLTVVTGWDYLRVGVRHMMAAPQPRES